MMLGRTFHLTFHVLMSAVAGEAHAFPRLTQDSSSEERSTGLPFPEHREPCWAKHCDTQDTPVTHGSRVCLLHSAPHSLL